MRRMLAAALALTALTGCTSELAPSVLGSGIGAFQLEHLVVIVDEPTQGPLSRKAEDEDLKLAVQEAVDKRFRRFRGGSNFSLGVKVVGYVLAQPGIPVLYAPRSILFLNVNVYDHVPKRLNAEPKRMTIFEDAGGDTVVGSGYTQSAEEQLKELSENAAIEIEKWLRENPQWFEVPAPEPEGEDTAAQS